MKGFVKLSIFVLLCFYLYDMLVKGYSPFGDNMIHGLLTTAMLFYIGFFSNGKP